MFSRYPGGEVDAGPSLYTVDISGRFDEQLVPTPAFASDPAWSPLLSQDYSRATALQMLRRWLEPRR
jgi:hypothetical protein